LNSRNNVNSFVAITVFVGLMSGVGYLQAQEPEDPPEPKVFRENLVWEGDVSQNWFDRENGTNTNWVGDNRDGLFIPPDGFDILEQNVTLPLGSGTVFHQSDSTSGRVSHISSLEIQSGDGSASLVLSDVRNTNSNSGLGDQSVTGIAVYRDRGGEFGVINNQSRISLNNSFLFVDGNLNNNFGAANSAGGLEVGSVVASGSTVSVGGNLNGGTVTASDESLVRVVGNNSSRIELSNSDLQFSNGSFFNGGNPVGPGGTIGNSLINVGNGVLIPVRARGFINRESPSLAVNGILFGAQEFESAEVTPSADGIEHVNTGIIEGSGRAFGGFTNRGTIHANVPGETLEVSSSFAGTFENEGVIQVSNGGILSYVGDLVNAGGRINVSGGGQFSISGDGRSSGSLSGGILTTDSSSSISLRDVRLDNIRNEGTLELDGVDLGDGIVNVGTIVADGAGVSVNSFIDNSGGVLSAPDGGFLSGSGVEISGGTLSTGAFSAITVDGIRLTNISNEGNLVLQGNYVVLDGFTNPGETQLVSGTRVTLASPFTNTGTLSILSPSLGIDDPFDPGLIDPFDPGLIDPFDPGLAFTFDPEFDDPADPGLNIPVDSKLGASSEKSLSAGLETPDEPPFLDPSLGATFTGDLILADTSVLEFEITDLAFQGLIVEGDLTLGGDLKISFGDGFDLEQTDSFTFLLADNLQGSFDNIVTGDTVGSSDGQYTFQFTGNGQSLSIGNIVATSVPEPSSIFCLGFFGLATASCRRRR
ncbi:hypothetical protein N9Y42_03535, partial [Mariniblastus sp.]|nr:hypothetical protein [Mariniblastus sp.]